MPSYGNMLVPLASDTAGHQLIGKHIFFKWPTYGWCLGRISKWNSNPKCTVCKQMVNFTVFYPNDGSFEPHCLLLDNYNIDTDNNCQCPNHTLLLLEPSNP